MAVFSGRKRVVITNVLPAVDCGRYPAKAIVDMPLVLSADIFTDGIDKIGAVVLIKHSSAKQWKELTLEQKDNDRWATTFTPTEPGTYSFQLQAWTDTFGTWQDAITKKHEAGQDITLDLKAGMQIAEEFAKRATGKVKSTITAWADKLGAATIEEGVAMSRDESMAGLFYKCRDKNRITTHPHTFLITVDQRRAGFSAWYELFPRSAGEPGRHGTFNDVRRLLPRISAMGFDVLYLPPIHPIGVTKRKGKNNSLNAAPADPGSPWAIGNQQGGHKSIHPELGTLADLRQLVSAARDERIEIAMDIAFQCSPDHPYVKEHPEWFKWRPDGTVQFAENPPKKYEDILPFDFDSEDWKSLWEELKSVIKYWADNGVYIFRVDNPHTKPLPFWQWVIDELKQEYPQLVFLAEAFTRPRIMEELGKIGFSQSYTYFAWRNTKEELETYLKELTQTDRRYYFRPNFWPNTPDILTDELVHGGENAHIMRLILAATLSSNYGIYGPVYDLCVHDAMPGKEEYQDNEKYEIRNWDWGVYTKVREVITRINRIRRENIAFHIMDNIEFAVTESDKIICYMKADAERKNIIIIVVNLDPHATQETYVKLPLYKFGIPYDRPFTVKDLLSGDKFEWSEWNFVSLNPNDLPAHVLRVEHLPESHTI